MSWLKIFLLLSVLFALPSCEDENSCANCEIECDGIKSECLIWQGQVCHADMPVRLAFAQQV